jgi:hypothetical protein
MDFTTGNTILDILITIAVTVVVGALLYFGALWMLAL